MDMGGAARRQLDAADERERELLENALFCEVRNNVSHKDLVS